MKLDLLKEFVLKASQATYASERSDIRQAQSDKSTTITYEDPDFPGYFYHDNYFGGEPYGGREIVSINGQPVWIMVYYGWINEEQDQKEVYSMLTKALRMSTIDMPYRGPKLYEEENWRYENVVNGDFKNFDGVEKIFKDGELIYEAKYIGGLVDQGAQQIID